MAGYEEAVIFESFPRMALEEGPVAVERMKCKDFVRETVFVSETKDTSEMDLEAMFGKAKQLEVELDLEAMFGKSKQLEVDMDLEAMIGKAKQLQGGMDLEAMLDKAKHLAVDSRIRFLVDEIRKENTSKSSAEAGKAAAVIDDIQTEKMDKAPVESGKAVAAKMDKATVEALDGGKNQFCTMIREATVDTGKEAVAMDKYQLPADYVRSILAMPREVPFEDMPYLEGDNLAKLMGVTEEWLEEERKLYKEEVARMQRSSKDFGLFQDKVREEFYSKGYVEVDDEYLNNLVKMQEYSNKLWKDPSWFDYYEPEPEEGLCYVK